MNAPSITQVCLAWLFLSGLAYGEEFTAKVIEVLDGDTVLLVHNSRVLRIRLVEIDAPENVQAYGKESTQSLSSMVKGKQVKFTSQTMDQYGRMLAHLNIDGLDVNTEQIRRGMAWEYSHYHSNKALIALQNEAKRASRGLWIESDPIPPWKWRKLHPGTISTATATPPTTEHQTIHGTNCGSKRSCSEMSSCDEAKYYFEPCGLKYLDGDDNGTPCEILCLPQKVIKN